MSFLYDRLIAHVDKITRDPEGDAIRKADRAKLKDYVKENQDFIDSQKRFLFNKMPKTIRDPVAIAYEDTLLLKAILDELDKANKSATDYDTLHEKVDEIMTRYNALARNSFATGTVWSEKTKNVGRNVRLIYYYYINFIRQALHDYPDMPSEYKSKANEIILRLRNTLDENLYTNDNMYDSQIQDLKNKYDSDIQQLQNRTGLWEEKGIMRQIYTTTEVKYRKNNSHIDFKELDTDPELLTDVIKSKQEFDALKVDKEQDTFDILSMFKTTLTTGLTVGIILVLIFLALIGSSVSTNLNIYKPVGYRIIYAIYGFIFSPIVLLYATLYRGWWLGKKPVYYGFIPLVPYFFINRYTQFFLGWMTYKPDNHIWDLQEWRHHTHT